MSDKKAGSRDISELKARLGLKKGGAAAGKGNGGQASAGVVAPPGLVPQQKGPVIPNAADDPFAAMNVMAAAATVARSQDAHKEVIVVREGEHVEHLGEKSTLALALKIGIPAVIGVVVGFAVGKILTSRGFTEDGMRGAKAILGDKTTPSTVMNLKRTLFELDNVLDDASKNGFKPNLDVDKKLKEITTRLDLKNEAIVFRQHAGALDGTLSGQMIAFYAGVQQVKQQLEAHNRAAVGDDILLKKGKTEADTKSMKDGPLNGQPRYAVLVTAPTENEKNPEFGAKLVEIAGYFCGGKSPQPKCPEGQQPSGYAYRTEVSSTPIQGDLVTTGSDSVPTKKLLQLLPNSIRDSIIKGGEPTASEWYYTRRLRALYELVHGKPGPDGKPAGGLLDDGNKLETRLSATVH